VSLEDLVNVPLDKFIDGRYYYEQDKMVIESKKPVLGHITRYEFYNGFQMIAKTYRIPLLNELGEVYSVLVIVEDITEELKAGEERQKMLDLLNQQAKMAEMGAMINIILHQWKQPLNVISLINQSLLENIKDGSSTPAQAEEELKQMADNIAFLAQTVVDFSDFFKNNKTVTKFEVQEVFKEVYNLLEKQFLKEDISVVINSTNGFAVSSLRNEFKQVILNLYNNSKDALMTKTTGNREIMVKFRIEDGFGIIRYSDNGGGIDSQLLPEKVFEPYVSTKGSAGSGIGLYICRSIIRENMHGDISAGNDQYGAVFEIRLPLSAE
jgi:signal transduction histidine kinase